MLGKLIKYEWKRAGKVLLLLILITLGAGLLGELYLLSPLWRGMFNAENTIGQGIGAFFMGIFCACIVAMVIGGIHIALIIWLGIRYHRSMFSREGYLTHTLPAKPVELFGAKVIVAGVCNMLLSLVIFGMTVILILSAICTAIQLPLGEILESMETFWQGANSFYREEIGYDLWILLLGLFLFWLLAAFSGAVILFGSLTLGQYSSRHKGVMAIVSFVLVLIVISLTNSTFEILASAYFVMSKRVPLFAQPINYEISVGVNVIFAVILFVWANHILKHNLNLE